MGRGANRCAATSGRNRRNARAHSSTDVGKPGVRIAPIWRACSRKRRGWSAQSSKSARGDSRAAARTCGSSAAAQIASEPPVLVPTMMTLLALATRRIWVMAARKSSIQPCSEKSPLELPHPRKVNVRAGYPMSFAMRSVSSGNVPAERRASRGPIGNP